MNSLLFGLQVFAEFIRKRPVRFLIGGIAVMVWFHIFRFWAAQAGVYANVQLPTSIYTPSLGWNMIVGPIIEITKDINPNDCWKKIIFSILIILAILNFALNFIKKTKAATKYKRISEQALRIAVFVFVPALLLPRSGLGVSVDIAGAIAVCSLLLSLGSRSRDFQALAMLIALGAIYCSINEYYERGKAFVANCELQAAIGIKDQSYLLTGCWITSSERYIVLKSNDSQIIVIPRDDATKFFFTPKGEHPL